MTSLCMQLLFSGEREKYHGDESALPKTEKERGQERRNRISSRGLRFKRKHKNSLPLSPLKCNLPFFTGSRAGAPWLRPTILASDFMPSILLLKAYAACCWTNATCLKGQFFYVVPSIEETSFQPPYMVFISVIIHITHNKLQTLNELCVQLPCTALCTCSLICGMQKVMRLNLTI